MTEKFKYFSKYTLLDGAWPSGELGLTTYDIADSLEVPVARYNSWLSLKRNFDEFAEAAPRCGGIFLRVNTGRVKGMWVFNISAANLFLRRCVHRKDHALELRKQEYRQWLLDETERRRKDEEDKIKEQERRDKAIEERRKKASEVVSPSNVTTEQLLERVSALEVWKHQIQTVLESFPGVKKELQKFIQVTESAAEH